jgi:hypothetical protein
MPRHNEHEAYETWEAAERATLLRLYANGHYRTLCQRYCHEGWSSDAVDAGICSYRVTARTEDQALALVAAHIKAEVLVGHLGC